MSFSFSEEEVELLKSLREQTVQEFERLKDLHSETRKQFDELSELQRCMSRDLDRWSTRRQQLASEVKVLKEEAIKERQKLNSLNKECKSANYRLKN